MLRSARIIVWFLPVFLLGRAAPGQTFSNASQRLYLKVEAVTHLTVSGDPAPLIIYRSPGVTSSLDVREASSRYSMTTNRETWSITASIDRPMPHGMHLSIQMESTCGVSNGQVEISNATAPVQLVRGREPGTERDAPITYFFSINDNIDFAFLDSRIITLTVTE